MNLIIFILLVLYISARQSNKKMGSDHSDNWAVLVGTSRFWFNYRHISNVLGIYHILKENGIQDDHIILMLSDDVACNPRNKYPGHVFNHVTHTLNLFSDDVEIDYKGYEVTVDNFLRVLLGRHQPEVPKHKRLRSDSNSNVLVYITGHGGDEFVKFQDSSEISASDMADAITQMDVANRFSNLFLILDSCQASTFFQRVKTRNVVTAASSSLKESSYSHTNDYDIGVSVIDRFTYYTLDYFEQIKKRDEKWWESSTLQDLFKVYDPKRLNAHPKFTDTTQRGIHRLLLSDFFGKNIVIDFDFEASEEEGTQGSWRSAGWADLASFRGTDQLLVQNEDSVWKKIIWFVTNNRYFLTILFVLLLTLHVFI